MKYFNCLFLLFVVFYSNAQQLFNKPIVGGVTENSAKIFIRTTASANVILKYSTDSLFSNAMEKQFSTTTESYNFQMAELYNLTALTRYYYKVIINNIDNNEIYRFRTFPKMEKLGITKS
ncbi:MAG: hypothetical protein IPK18_07760 [Sphingobacteriales bacterium]|nr:MAG: hypothetical protein IPK18_07760 [Sphingobacteriales bacterium]